MWDWEKTAPEKKRKSELEKSAKKTVILVTGPTASGKTALAVTLARYFNTEIISADSRQCYREMSIGVARPADVELAAVPHHFIASHSVQEEVTAASFAEMVLQLTNELFKKSDYVILAGGTGLYIKAFLEGLDTIPEVPAAIREQVVQGYDQYGLKWLQEEIKKTDPLFYDKGEMQNPRRIMRALEVILATGQSILHYRSGEKAQRAFSVLKTGINLPKEILHRNIHTRTDQMMEAGLVNEVRALMPYRQLNALQTVGYTEIFACLDGKISLAEAVGQIKIHTRQYAKRQMTWFRKDPEIHWYAEPDASAIIRLAEEFAGK